MAKKILKEVNDYYSNKIKSHGATSQGVDWNGEESHFLRFEQLVKVLPQNKVSILDYGCGFGSLIDFLNKKKFNYKYFGFDISKDMIDAAKNKYVEKEIQFTQELDRSQTFDYTIANGIFNVKLDSSDEDWTKYIIDTLIQINELSSKGFAFNILTSFSDEEYKKSNLHYADPMFYFNYCKQNFSRNVALLHDYDLYEFTILVKK